MENDAPAEIVAISSQVVRGSVGNRAVVFSLEATGHPVLSLPTVILSWHPGHGPSTRCAIDDDAFLKILEDIARSERASSIRAVITGYFASPSQAEATAEFVARLKARNPGLLYLCDPVIGDEDRLYVSDAIAEVVRDQLIPMADIATPNRFELGWLAGAPLDSNAQALEAALSLGPRRVLVTSAVAMMAGGTGNLLLTERHALLAEHRLVDNAPKGLGDLTAALFLSRLIKGDSDERALQMATASVFEILARAVKRGSQDLMLAEDHHSFSTPMAMVQMRHLLHPARKRTS
jgi:pyridoxine kinase